MTVQEMLSKMSSREMTEWIALCRLEEAERKNERSSDEIARNLRD